MKRAIATLVIGAGALFATAASAAPLMLDHSASASRTNGIENVRLVCDQYGRCYQSNRGRRVVIQRQYDDSYGYAPRYERRGYYNDGPNVGVRVGPGGVGFGIGGW